MATDWNKLQAELDADAARILAACDASSNRDAYVDSLYGEVYGDLYTSTRTRSAG